MNYVIALPKNKVTLVEHPPNVGLLNGPVSVEVLQEHIDSLNKEGWELTSVRIEGYITWVCLWQKCERFL